MEKVVKLNIILAVDSPFGLHQRLHKIHLFPSVVMSGPLGTDISQ